MGRKYWKRQDDGRDTFIALSEFLSKGKNKEDRPYQNNTRIQKTGLGISIVLHWNRIATFFPGGEFWLDSCGWRTATTKNRIAEFLPLGWHLIQDKGIWWIVQGDNRWDSPNRMVFWDGVKLPTEFEPDKNKRELNRVKSLMRKIDKFCKKVKKEVDEFKVDDPGPGDCWGCMRTTDGKHNPMGTDHLMSHIEQGYVVPLLIFNAMDDAGYNMGFWWASYREDRQHKERKGWLDYGTTFSRAVKRYLKRNLGVAR